MALLNRQRITIAGSTSEDGSSPTTVEVWTTGLRDRVQTEGDGDQRAGGAEYDFGMLRFAFDCPLIPFCLVENAAAFTVDSDVHDNKKYLDLLAVLEMPYKFISATEGHNIAGRIAGTQFHTQLLNGGLFPVKLTGIETEWPDDNTKVVTLQMIARYRGVTMPSA